MVKDLVLLFK